jgi:hypothetical protein
MVIIENAIGGSVFMSFEFQISSYKIAICGS